MSDHDTAIAPQSRRRWDSLAGLPKVHLEIQRGWARHRIRPVLVPVFLIGAAPDCDLVLGDRQFPDVHTYLFLSIHGLALRHLGEGPPVVVDGRLVQRAQLRDGSRIGSGPYEFLVHMAPPSGARSVRIDRAMTRLRGPLHDDTQRSLRLVHPDQPWQALTGCSRPAPPPRATE